MTQQSTYEHVTSGLRKGLGAVLGILVLMFLIGGMSIISSHASADGNSFAARHSPATGWIMVIASTAIMALTVGMWAKVIPGFFAYGMLIGLVQIIVGHRMMQSSCAGGRVEGVAVVAILLTCTLLTRRFKEFSLQIVDKIALIGFIVCFAFGATLTGGISRRSSCPDNYIFLAIPLGLGILFLFFAWLYDRLRQPRLPRERTTQP